MTTPADPAAAFLAQLQTATTVVEIYRSSFPTSIAFSSGFDDAVAWMRENKPEVKVEILTDPLMADTLVFFRTDATVWAGPLWAPAPEPWLNLGIAPENFEQFFGDERNKLAHPEVIQPYNATPEMPDGTTLINDFSRLNETAVREVLGKQHLRWPWSAFTPTEADVCNVVAEAARNGHKISIAGKRHSQGGHTFSEDAVVIDITDFNEILGFDPIAKTIRVQSGTTWDQIQRFVAPHGLSVEIMQAYPFFTVGGSLGVSVHESDLRFGPIIDSVLSFRLLLADGRVLDVSPTQNEELFGLVIGGYGLIGLVLEVELQLTDDMLLTQTVTNVTSATFAAAFEQCLKEGTAIFGYARPCFALDNRFMVDTSMVTYTQVPGADPSSPLFAIQDLSYLALRKLIYDLSRAYDWAKITKWDLQVQYGDEFNIDQISRNNLMRADIRIPGDYRSSTDTDALQEYFVPCDRYADFAAGLGRILQAHHVNMISLGIRYVPQTTASVLSYSAGAAVFSAIMVINHDSSAEGVEAVRAWTREIIDMVISFGGTYYLPYAANATFEQSRAAYPRMAEFMAKKDKYDPNHVFYNRFFADYGA